MTCRCLILLLAAVPIIAHTSDLAREKRLAAEIEDSIVFGDPVYLEAGGASFLSIFTEAEEDPARGAVIVLHGRGFHPDWAQVAGPLRSGLAERGWTTLSIQLPVLEKEAKYYDYVPVFPDAFPRIDAAIQRARELDAGPVILAAHSCGAHMAMAYVRARGDAAFDGFIGIGMGATDYQQPMSDPFPLAEMRVPVLDIFGSEEYPAVKRMAPERLEALRTAGNPLSRQRVIDGANHYFDGQSVTDTLIEAVAEWLEEAFPMGGDV